MENLENWKQVLALVSIGLGILGALYFYEGAYNYGQMRTLRKPRRSTSNMEEWRVILQTL